MRSTGFWTGSGQALATEGLRSDNRADLVTIDIDIPNPQPIGDLLNAVTDTRMKPKGQAIAACVNVRHDLINLGGFECRNMQNGAENLALQISNPIDANNRRTNKNPSIRDIQLLNQSTIGLGHFNMPDDPFACIFIDNRANVRRKIPRVADYQFIHRARQHFQKRFRDIFLQIQQPQRGTTLPCRLKCRGDNILNRLFRQRCGIHDHRVDPTGFGNQWRVW